MNNEKICSLRVQQFNVGDKVMYAVINADDFRCLLVTEYLSVTNLILQDYEKFEILFPSIEEGGIEE